MKSKLSLLLLPLLAVGCESAEQIESEPAAEMAVSGSDAMTRVFPGSIFAVQLDQPLEGTTASQIGSTVTATTIEPLPTMDGSEAIPAGAVVHGSVAGYRPAGDGMPAMVSVAFERVVVGEESYPISGQVVHVDLSAEGRGEQLAGIVSAQDTEQLQPGVVVEDAGDLLTNRGGLPSDALAIALGWDRSATIPEGARLTVEFDRPAM